MSRSLRYGFLIALTLGGVLLYLLAVASSNTAAFDRNYPLLLAVNGAVALALAVLVVLLVARLVRRLRQRRFGARLMARFAIAFALIGVLPGRRGIAYLPRRWARGGQRSGRQRERTGWRVRPRSRSASRS